MSRSRCVLVRLRASGPIAAWETTSHSLGRCEGCVVISWRGSRCSDSVAVMTSWRKQLASSKRPILGGWSPLSTIQLFRGLSVSLLMFPCPLLSEFSATSRTALLRSILQAARLHNTFITNVVTAACISPQTPLHVMWYSPPRSTRFKSDTYRSPRERKAQVEMGAFASRYARPTEWYEGDEGCGAYAAGNVRVTVLRRRTVVDPTLLSPTRYRTALPSSLGILSPQSSPSRGRGL